MNVPGGTGATTNGYLSWPRRGKHLCFDGRYLHAAPADLMPEGEFERQRGAIDGEGTRGGGPANNDALSSDGKGGAGASEEDGDEGAEIRRRKAEAVLLRRRRRRVTFLVNVWLNYKPFGVKPFPEGMVDKLSGGREEEEEGGRDESLAYLFPRPVDGGEGEGEGEGENGDITRASGHIPLSDRRCPTHSP